MVYETRRTFFSNKSGEYKTNIFATLKYKTEHFQYTNKNHDSVIVSTLRFTIVILKLLRNLTGDMQIRTTVMSSTQMQHLEFCSFLTLLLQCKESLVSRL